MATGNAGSGLPHIASHVRMARMGRSLFPPERIASFAAADIHPSVLYISESRFSTSCLYLARSGFGAVAWTASLLSTSSLLDEYLAKVDQRSPEHVLGIGDDVADE